MIAKCNLFEYGFRHGMREIQKVKLILDHQITINTLKIFQLSILLVYPMKVSEDIKCTRVVGQVRRQRGQMRGTLHMSMYSCRVKTAFEYTHVHLFPTEASLK